MNKIEKILFLVAQAIISIIVIVEIVSFNNTLLAKINLVKDITILLLIYITLLKEYVNE